MTLQCFMNMFFKSLTTVGSGHSFLALKTPKCEKISTVE